MNKERGAQHEERIAATRRSQLREMAIEDQIEADRRAACAVDESKKGSAQLVRLQQKEMLQKQMADRAALASEAALEAEKDRAAVESVVAEIVRADASEQLERTRRKDECRALIAQYERQRERELVESRAAAALVEREIAAHASSLARRESELAALKQAKTQRDAENFRRIVAETERRATEDGELALLRDLLWEEEMEAARRAEELQRAAKREKSKRDMALANEAQLVAKKAQRSEDERRERRLVELMRDKFAQDERNELVLARARAEQKRKYVEAVELQRLERKDMYDQARRAELDENDYAAQAEDYKRQVVLEARRRLLMEHAHDLQGFLPKGTLQPEDFRPR